VDSGHFGGVTRGHFTFTHQTLGKLMLERWLAFETSLDKAAFRSYSMAIGIWLELIRTGDILIETKP
tara:strand:+ start:198 stop:398 length:201 start_codon:yes stop_codon:yes gene_type:complete